MITITLAIIILTCIVSFTAFNNTKITNDLIFYPVAIERRNEWWRFLSCALLHADIQHLAFNMISLYFFGPNLEKWFAEIFPGKGSLLFIVLYILSQFICLIPSYLKHKEDYHYKSLGASGAVTAIVFATILLSPLSGIGILFIPIPIPGFIFGFLYLGITMYMARKAGDNINHSAHFWGAGAGVILVTIFCYLLSGFDPISNFIFQIRSYLGL